MAFSTKLKQLRMASKLSQRQLSKLVDIPQTTLSDLENGKYEPVLSVARKIAKCFNKKIDELV